MSAICYKYFDKVTVLGQYLMIRGRFLASLFFSSAPVRLRGIYVILFITYYYGKKRKKKKTKKKSLNSEKKSKSFKWRTKHFAQSQSCPPRTQFFHSSPLPLSI